MSSVSSNVAKVVERQMRNWDLAKHQQVASEPVAPAETFKFYIAISRELASQGEEVADVLAERLNWPKYDKEILTYMSEEEQVRRRLYETLDERQRNWLQQLIDLLEPMGIEATRERDAFFLRLCESVLTIAQHQHAIFVGRGANFILPAGNGLSVRIVAPLQQRIARLIETEGLSQREARRRIRNVEAQRAEYLINHFGPRPYDPRRYDMMLNAGSLSVTDMSCLIQRAVECKTGKSIPCEKALPK